MNTSVPSFRKTIREGFSTFRIALFPILIFEIIYKTILALAIRPLFSLLLQIFLQISGIKVAFNADIWKFILSIPGFLVTTILLILSVILTYFEFSVIIIMTQQIIEQGKTTIKSGIIYALGTYRSLKGPDIVLFAFYSLLLLPLINMGLTSSLLPQLSIPKWA